ncbi:3-isopropylmalate dehydratase large subunit [Geodia barretti]|uniref:3-isopropylmalate dehydratase large subunit n=1 Tax=Geodia barretti TaxID=519541 RepID=A0AA35X918_GEOBA|nr:3-isopropylmalate dehydratase large subunit [Geodia barretti]
MVHDVSGPGVLKVFERLREQGIPVDRLKDPSKVWVAEDHFVPSADKISAENIVKLSNFTREYGIEKHFRYGMGQYGICHTLSHEEALVLPGQVYVGGDSHTNTTGALGAFACGLGHTDVAYVLLNGRIWFKVPETLYFQINGRLPDHVMAKDLILRIIGEIGTDGGAYRAMQFGGSGVENMSVEGRLTLTNMTTEAGAKNGIIEPDQKVYDYLDGRGAASYTPVHGDGDAEYARVYEYEAEELEPVVAEPFSPANISVVREAPSTPLDKAYIGSCTGAKMEDLEAAARVLKARAARGRRVAPGVDAMVVPGSQDVKRQAEEMGLDRVFRDAGFEWRESGCSMCLGMNPDILEPGQRCASTSNRNFEGRQGAGGRTHLVSPVMAAAAAVSGHFVDVREMDLN